jgi:hypothetical protein
MHACSRIQHVVLPMESHLASRINPGTAINSCESRKGVGSGGGLQNNLRAKTISAGKCQLSIQKRSFVGKTI